MQTRRTLSLIALSFLLTTAPAFAGTVEVEGEGTPALYVVKVHADWCSSCKALVPILDEVRETMSSEPVLFLTLDVTDADRTGQARLLAAALGIEQHLKTNNKTGLVLIINPADKALLETLTRENTADEMVGKIEGHIAETADEDEDMDM